jgi:hypothetical protein
MGEGNDESSKALVGDELKRDQLKYTLLPEKKKVIS